MLEIKSMLIKVIIIKNYILITFVKKSAKSHTNRLKKGGFVKVVLNCFIQQSKTLQKIRHDDPNLFNHRNCLYIQSDNYFYLLKTFDYTEFKNHCPMESITR